MKNDGLTLESHKFLCAWCEREFESRSRGQFGADMSGRNVFCSRKCLTAMSNRNSRARFTLGPCPTCGHMFQSARHEKRFCSMKCYVNSPEIAARLSGHNERIRKPPKTCPHCGKQFQHKAKRYCSNLCRRAYFAARFDRFVANPEQLSLPQCYDEFLDREELPCLIDGCDWAGKHLSAHVNFTHGITADKLRELAGFNKHTGLVSRDLSAQISQRFRQLIEAGKILCIRSNGVQFISGAARHPLSNEAKEHYLKARAVMVAEGPSRPPIPCRMCHALVEQPTLGRKLYCSTICRTKYYASINHAELTCSYCGGNFLGNRYKVLRAQRGQKVCCSDLCRNRMNMIACLAARNLKSDKLAMPVDILAGIV